MPPSTRPSASVCAMRFMPGGWRSRLLVPVGRRVKRLCGGGGGRENDLELALLYLADHAAHQQLVAITFGRELDAAVEGLVVGNRERVANGLGIGALGRLHGEDVGLDAGRRAGNVIGDRSRE